MVTIPLFFGKFSSAMRDSSGPPASPRCVLDFDWTGV